MQVVKTWHSSGKPRILRYRDESFVEVLEVAWAGRFVEER